MSTPLTDALARQGDLKPGDEGYWKVYGASTRDIQEGDLVMYKTYEARQKNLKEYVEREIAFRFPREGFIDDVSPCFKDTEGNVFRLGCMMPVVVLRKGTHNILSEYVR
jgi:hypothetical protein